MTLDPAIAFHSLEARVDALAGPDILDRISLRDHVVSVEIGAFQVERDTVQRLSFDVVVEVAPPDNPLLDDVDRILSYDTIAQAIAQELAAERLNLLETLADRIAARLLLEKQAQRVFVRVQKLDRGPGALGVEIVRSHAPADAAETLPTTGDQPRPVLVFLSNKALISNQMSNWLDQINQASDPIVICLEPMENGADGVADGSKQHRIDLLSTEQNAWALSARYPEFVVADSRTELDWAMRNGQTSIWAPSKIALDAISSPTGDAAKLVHWFARDLGACDLLLIGGDLTDAADNVRFIGLDQQSLGLNGSV